MELPAGGAVWFPLANIARVVAHEVDLTPEERRLPAMDLGLGTKDAGPGGPDRASGLGDSQGDGLDPAEPDPKRSISGKVLNEAGEPVPGIDLTAHAMRLFQETERLKENAHAPQSVSDEDGSYQFEQLAEGEYRISSVATDRYPAAHTVARTGVDFANLVVSETRRLWVYGSVTDSDQEPLQGVKVTPRGQPDKAVVTDYAGHYVLEMSVAGRGRNHELRFALAGYHERALSLPVSRMPGDEIQLDARLEPINSLATVAGWVSASDGGPVSGETVLLLGETRYHALTNAVGEFLIPEVVADAAYRLSIRPGPPYRDHEERVRVGATGLHKNVVLEPLDYGTLSGRMIDLLGNPVPHFNLWLHTTDVSAQRLLVTGDAGGRYAVADVPTGPLSFATLANPRFTISGPALSPRRPEGSVDLVLDWGGHEIRGRILDAGGNPVAAPQVTLYWAYHQYGVQSRAVRHTSVAADGSFRFSRLGPGAHTVTVHAPGFHSMQLEAESPGDLVVELRRNEGETAIQGGR
jgi:protocatechuate 3,4-dioxygenase beta subunit